MADALRWSYISGVDGSVLASFDTEVEFNAWFEAASEYRHCYSVFDVHPLLRARYAGRNDRRECWLVPHGFYC